MKRVQVSLDAHEAVAMYWAIDFYLAASGGLMSKHMRPELLAGAERAQAIAQTAIREMRAAA